MQILIQLATYEVTLDFYEYFFSWYVMTMISLDATNYTFKYNTRLNCT